MNIFYLDRAAHICAKYHCDKHVNKMLIETVQILTTALHLNGLSIPDSYKPTHKKHPCVLWTYRNRLHYNWLYELGMELGREFRVRYGHSHKSHDKLFQLPTEVSLFMPVRQWEDPPQAMPDKYKQLNTVHAYRDYYRGEKRHIAKWYRGKYTPSWWK